MTSTPIERVTIADIASFAGVSVPTVSKVLNGKPGVSRATRTKINALLHEHEYEPRRTALTGAIGLVFGELDSPWSVALVSSLEEAAFQSGLGVVLTRMRPDSDDSWLDLISARHIDGVVFGVVALNEDQRERLRELGLPFVIIDPQASQPTDVVTVGIAHWRGARDATEYLIRLGHTRIGMISGPGHMIFSQARTDGFRAAAAAAGIEVAPGMLIQTEFGYQAGRDAAEELLSAAVRPTAIFAASDEQAFGAYDAARLAGLRIPQDLSIVGFNDVPVARWASPPLTTVREPIVDMAREAVRLLRVQIDGQPSSPAVELATELVIRESTAPPPIAKD